jgi:hypothetical protein
MRKLVKGLFWPQRKSSTIEIKKALSENNTCYVLITCTEASKDGKMEVEMTYGGDPILAAYLVESAQNIIDTDIT